MGGLPQSQEVEFFVGDHVEVAAVVVDLASIRHSSWPVSPHPYTGPIGSMTRPTWIEAIIIHKSTYAGAWEYDIAHPKDPTCKLHMHHNWIKTNMRVLVPVAPPVPMAESCLECKTTFIYPIEFNHECGRVCFSCKSTYAWKYFP